MTVAQLIRDLEHYPSGAEVIFATRAYCPEGYPEWESVWIKEEENGKVYIEMNRLTQECMPNA